MNCNSVKQKLIYYLEGDLSLIESNIVKKHVDNCSECRFYLSELKKSLAIIETEKIKEINTDFYSKLSNRLDEIENDTPVYSIKYIFMQVIAYAAVIAIGIFIGLFTENKINNISENDYSEYTEEIIVWNDFAQEPIETFLLSE